MLKLILKYDFECLYGVLAATLAYQILSKNTRWDLITFGVFCTILCFNWVTHQELGLIGKTAFRVAILLLISQISLVGISTIQNYHTLQRLTNAPYLTNKMDLRPIPLPVLRKLVKRIGVNTYGGELISQDIIHQNYNIPEYLYPAMQQQAKYVNSLQQAKLISGVPVALSYFNLPSAHDIKKVEDTTATKYMNIPNLQNKTQRRKRLPSDRQAYRHLVYRIQMVSSPAFLIQNTMPIKQLIKFKTMLKRYNSRIKVRAMFTHFLGNQALVKLYNKDTIAMQTADKCHIALGANNPECRKATIVLSYFKGYS